MLRSFDDLRRLEFLSIVPREFSVWLSKMVFSSQTRGLPERLENEQVIQSLHIYRKNPAAGFEH